METIDVARLQDLSENAVNKVSPQDGDEYIAISLPMYVKTIIMRHGTAWE